MIPFLQRNIKYYEFILTVLIQIIAVLYFNWLIADVFMLFFFDLFFIGLATSIKILFSPLKSTFWKRLGACLKFLLVYLIAFLCIIILVGNFTDGTKLPNPSSNNNIISFSIATQITLLLIYFLTGKYKLYAYPTIINLSIKRMVVMFFILMLFLIPFYWVSSNSLNYIMVVAIIVVKAGIDNVVMIRQNKIG